METEELLESVGLTRQESRCFLALYELQEAQTGKLSKIANIATANIYPVLESLMNKGLVSYRIQNNKKVFIANPPETLQEFIEKKQEELNILKSKVAQTIAHLKVRQFEEKAQSHYKYYEGMSGIKSMWYELAEILPSLDRTTVIKIHSSKKGTFERLLAFYDEFHKVRKQIKMNYRLIITNEESAHGEKRRKEGAEVRYMDLKNETQWGVIGNYFFMYYTIGNKPRSFLIKDEKFTQSFGIMFDEIWALARP